MSMLPAEFSDLEFLAPEWALSDFNDRLQKRAASSMEDLRRFYDAVQPRADAALTYLEAFPLDTLPSPQASLMRLLHSLAQVAMAVEMHGQPKVGHASLPIAVRVLRESGPV